MSQPVRIKGLVQEARYIREEKSLVIIVRDPETRMCSKPMQISSSHFTFRPDQDVDDEMEKTASLLRAFPHPINLVFEGTAEPSPPGLSPAALDGPVVPAGMEDLIGL
jgi:hypothetical protein